MEDPTNCDRCGTSLEYGWSQRYQEDKLIESICFDCDDKQQIEEYNKTNVLTSKIMTLALVDEVKLKYGKETRLDLKTLNKILSSNINITLQIKNWERDVWFNGLQKKVRESEFRGWNLDFDGGCVMVYSLVGRTQFTIEATDHSAQITIITEEDSMETRMGQNSIMATEDQAIDLLCKSREAYINGAQFKKNDEVGLGF